MSFAILFHLCAQHVSDINISIIRSLRLFCWITTLVVLFLVRCVLASACNTDTTPTQPHRNSNIHRTKNNTTNVVIQQNSRKLLMMDILMSETCWAHKKWNKIARDIKLVFYSSTITMMYGPINIRCLFSMSTQNVNSLCGQNVKLFNVNTWGRWRRAEHVLWDFSGRFFSARRLDYAVLTRACETQKNKFRWKQQSRRSFRRPNPPSFLFHSPYKCQDP